MLWKTRPQQETENGPRRPDPLSPLTSSRVADTQHIVPRDTLLLLGMSRPAAIADIWAVLVFMLVENFALGSWYQSYAPGRSLDAQTTGWLCALCVAGKAMLFLVLLLAYLSALPLSAVGLHWPVAGRQLLWGAAWALIACVAVFGWVEVDSLMRRAMAGAGGQVPWTWARTQAFGNAIASINFVGSVLLMVIPVMGEEALFRGLLLPRLRRVTGQWWSAVALCSLLFAWYHRGGGLTTMVSAFVMSVVFCMALIQSRSVIVAFVAHFVYNVVQFGLARW